MNDKKSEKIKQKGDGLDVDSPVNALPGVTIAQLSPALQKACEQAGWTSLTPVQEYGLPYLLEGRDIMVQSHTGSGKTGCYLLPMLQNLDPAQKEPQALVLVPTRELALQVEKEAGTLFKGSGLKACALYGGVSYTKQLQALEAGTQVIVGTPGRVLDHLIRRSLKLKTLRMMVFDEADRMLSIGFYPDMVEVARHLPPKRQTVMFSATYPPRVLRLAAEFMRDPEMLSLSRNEVHVADVQHMFSLVKHMDKDRALIRLIETENPSSAIIFCNTKADVQYVTDVLRSFGYRAAAISSDLSQRQREDVLSKLRRGEIQFLVATDVAARGIDIPDLSHVFMFDPPDDQESYIHRAGRTGRAGAAGTVITLVDPRQKIDLDRLAKHYKISMRQLPVPDDEAISGTLGVRLNALLENRLRSLSGLEKMRADRYLPLARELADLSGDEDEGKLNIIAMLLDDYHRMLREGRRSSLPSMPERPQRPASRGGSRRRPAPRRKGAPKPPAK